MSYFASLLILAAVAAPVRESRHVDAIEIFSCDFSDQWDANFDGWPDKWTRCVSFDCPHYVEIELKNDAEAVASRCLSIDLKGGGAGVSSPALAVSDKFSYVIEARIRSSKLKYGRTRIKVDFCDGDRNVLETTSSQWFQSTEGWKKIHLGPVNIASSKVQLAIITLQVERGKHIDLEAQICLDDVWMARLPRMMVQTNSPFNVYTDPNDVVVTCHLSGVLEKDPDIRFELLDASSQRLDDDTVQLEGTLIAERVSGASDIISSTKEHVNGYAGSTQWRPPIDRFGYYRVRVSMQTARGKLKEHVISIAVVPPIQKNSRGEFGWSLAGDDIPLDFEQLVSLLPRVAVSWVKLPVWYGENETERGEQLVHFTERLAAEDIEVIGVIDRPPRDLDIGKRLAADATIADLLSVEEPSSWLPSLDAVLTRLSLRVRWWQLGTDRDTSFSDFHLVENEIERLRKQLFRFGQDVNLGIGWPWNQEASADRQATWDFQQLSATPSLTGDEMASYLDLPKRLGVARWALVEPLPLGYYDLETRTRDLVEQMLAAKIHGADGIFVAEPFDDQRGIMTDAGTPGELLLPWRTTASLLSGAKYLGQIRMPGGSENRIFRTDNDDVLMVVWSRRPQQEILYLGDQVRVVDVWGRSEAPGEKEYRQVLEVGQLPKFVLGLNPHIAQWRMNAHFSESHVPSVFGIAHSNRIKIENPFDQGVGCTVKLVGPEGWQVVPDKLDFKLSGGEKASKSFQIVLPFDANSGTATLRADFAVAADQPYRFSVFRTLSVGDEFIELELHTRLDEEGALIVEQRMVNHADTPTDFKCLLYAEGRRRQRMQVYRLGNTHDIKKYTYPNGADLIGTELWLRAEELSGTRVLNHRITIEQ